MFDAPHAYASRQRTRRISSTQLYLDLIHHLPFTTSFDFFIISVTWPLRTEARTGEPLLRSNYTIHHANHNVSVTLSPSSPQAGSWYRLSMPWLPCLKARQAWVSRVCCQGPSPCSQTGSNDLRTASNGIVIATEKKSSSILIDDSMLDKVAVICPNIGIVYSGMGPDFRVLVAKARKSAQSYWKIYGEYPPTRVLTQEIATVMQQATQSGYALSRILDFNGGVMAGFDDSQWCPALWGFFARCRFRHEPRTNSIPG